ncbi:polyprenyl synthetase family protein [Anaerolineales bacterium HSG25]|nr:polyprenyl synthetase family protein [Anaerolineales bacterium HSG25]
MSDITHLLELVADDMHHVEEKMRSGVAERYPDLAAVVDYLMGAGGKRLRPVLSLMASKFFTADPDKNYALAASVELLHTATLVHDDLIDHALLRRGMPTLNASWSAGSTILTGDYLFARSAELSAETESVRIVKLFAQTLMTIVSGELQQLFNDGHDQVPTREQYEQRIYAKTASLFSAGTEGAAILGGATQAQEDALRKYGDNLGKAFQIMDDVLDFQGDEDVVGKPVANDLRQGIATLPVMLFSQNNPSHPTINTIKKAIIREDVSDEEILAIVEAIRTSGAIETTLEEARHYARQAQVNLQIFPDSQYRQAMLEIADYAVARDV